MNRSDYYEYREIFLCVTVLMSSLNYTQKIISRHFSFKNKQINKQNTKNKTAERI